LSRPTHEGIVRDMDKVNLTLVADDLNGILEALEAWARKNDVTDEEFFAHTERIYSVAHTLKALEAGVK